MDYDELKLDFARKDRIGFEEAILCPGKTREHVDAILDPVVIVVAGMDAALPTVVGGLVGSAVFAVPTSTGYGVAAGGETALRAVLASCSPGLAVMNIEAIDAAVEQTQRGTG